MERVHFTTDLRLDTRLIHLSQPMSVCINHAHVVYQYTMCMHPYALVVVRGCVPVHYVHTVKLKKNKKKTRRVVGRPRLDAGDGLPALVGEEKPTRRVSPVLKKRKTKKNTLKAPKGARFQIVKMCN